MNKSDDIKDLVVNLVKAKNEFKTPKKTAKVDFTTKQGRRVKYDWAPMDEVISATEQALLENGLTIAQYPISDGETLGIETMILHESGQYISNKFQTRLGTADSQEIGGIITYYRRYSYLAILGLAPEDDDSGTASDNYKSSTGRNGGGGAPFTCGSPKQQQFLLKLIGEDSGIAPTAATKEWVAKLSPDEIKKKISEYLDKKK